MNHWLHTQVQEINPNLANAWEKIDSVEAVVETTGGVGIVGVLEVSHILVGLIAAEAWEDAAGSRMSRDVVAKVTEAGGNSSLMSALLVG